MRFDEATGHYRARERRKMDEDKNTAAERDEKDARFFIFYFVVFARQNQRFLQRQMFEHRENM